MPSIFQWLLTAFVFYAQVDSRQVPKFSVFSKSQVFLNKRVMLSRPKGAVTENESFLYALCDSQSRVFVQERCNVTVETPAFANATYKETCILNFVSDNPHHESFTNLHLHTFGDDKALISWVVRDQDLRTKLSKIRILRLTNCKYYDLSIPSEETNNIIAYENTFDVIIKNKTFCGVENCKVTFDVDGKKVHGPMPYLSNANFYFVSDIIPGIPHVPIKGFFLQMFTNSSVSRSIVVVSPEGKALELLNLKNPKSVKMSNSHNAFGICWSSEKTNITCKQYDAKIDIKLNVVFEFLDQADLGDDIRWFQPHNLQEGGLLLVTGNSDITGQKFNSFSIFKVRLDGHKERPLVVEGLDLECLSNKFFVSVSENDEDEFCFHFTCQLDKYGDQGLTSYLNLETKCLLKKFASIPKHRASLIN